MMGALFLPFPTKDDHWLKEPMVEGFPFVLAEVVYGVREEMAISIENILACRTGLQLLSWEQAKAAAPGGHLLCCCCSTMTPHRLRRSASHLPARSSRQNAIFIYRQALSWISSTHSESGASISYGEIFHK
jgi:hypothetical protein